MISIQTILRRVVSALFILVTLVTSAFFVNEARKEIVFLCENFTIGTEKRDILRQLETANFLYYTETTQQNTTYLKVASHFTLNLVTCDIYLDESKRVYRRRSSHSPN